MDAALRQIEEQQYRADLENRGISGDRIRKYGFAFEGKEVLIKSNRSDQSAHSAALTVRKCGGSRVPLDFESDTGGPPTTHNAIGSDCLNGYPQ